MYMYKIIEDDGGKFRIKEVDDSGNSVRLLDEVFTDRGYASDFITKIGKKTSKTEDTEEVKEDEFDGIELDDAPKSKKKTKK